MKFETTTETLAQAVSMAARFSERRANLPVLGCVLITAEGDRLTLRATNLECGVEIMVPAKITPEAQDLVRAIRSVAYCASLSAVKPELQSVLLYGEAGKLVAVATDSFRLAEKQMPLNSGGAIPQLLVPARNAAELMKVLEHSKGD